jgi:hypothetical protein
VLDAFPDIVSVRGLLNPHSGVRTGLHYAAETAADDVFCCP